MCRPLSVACLLLAGCAQPAPPEKAQPGAPTGHWSDASRVAAHEFWTRRPAPADIERIVSTLRQQEDNCIVYVGREGQYQAVTDPDHVRSYRGTRDAFAPSNTHVSIDLRRYDRKPSREQVLADLLDEMDQAAHRAEQKNAWLAPWERAKASPQPPPVPPLGEGGAGPQPPPAPPGTERQPG
jgi:hypothetical protein